MFIADLLFHTARGQFISATIFGLALGLLILFSVRRDIDKGYINKKYEHEYVNHAITGDGGILDPN